MQRDFEFIFRGFAGGAARRLHAVPRKAERSPSEGERAPDLGVGLSGLK
jgi:hypothetical protein